jgi:hypothetical protein
LGPTYLPSDFKPALLLGWRWKKKKEKEDEEENEEQWSCIENLLTTCLLACFTTTACTDGKRNVQF